MARTGLSPAMERWLRVAKHGVTIALIGVMALSALASLSNGKLGSSKLRLANSGGKSSVYAHAHADAHADAAGKGVLICKLLSIHGGYFPIQKFRCSLDACLDGCCECKETAFVLDRNSLSLSANIASTHLNFPPYFH
jgi:hypothetical protein